MSEKSKLDSQDSPIEKSRRLISLDEFSKSVTLRKEELAGLKAYTKNQRYMSREDWKSKLLEYKTRTLKEG